MIRKSLLFLSPDGGESGGTALAENQGEVHTTFTGEPGELAAEQELRPPGELFTEEMARQQGKEPAPAPDKKDDDPPPPAKKEEKKPKAASAVEAALEAEETAPAPEAVKSELDDLPETLPTQGRGAHWDKARGKIGRLEGVVSELNGKLAEASQKLEAAGKPSPELVAENDLLKKTLAEYEDALLGLNVDYHPETRKKYVEGRQSIVTKAADKLKAYGGEPQLIVEALGQPEGRQRNDLLKQALADLEDTEKARVLHFVSEIEKLDDERADLQKDPKDAWGKLQAAERAVAQQKQSEIETFKKGVFDKTLNELPKSHFLLRTVDPTIPGADEHNDFNEKAKAAAWRLLGPDATPQELAAAALKSQLTDRLQKLYVEARKENKTLLSRIGEYEKSEPGFNGKKPAAKSAIEEQLDKSPGTLFMESMEKQRENI